MQGQCQIKSGGDTSDTKLFPTIQISGYQGPAVCVVSLVDRLTHHAEIVPIEGNSYRLREAQQRNEQRAQKRRQKKP